MRTVLCGLLFLVITGWMLSAQAQDAVLHCGTLINPGASEAPVSEQTIRVEDGRVAAVETGYSEAPDGVPVIDLRAAVCMPGFIDGHTHLTSQSEKGGYVNRVRLTPADQVLKAVPYARRTLMAGFTTVRDVGASEGIDLALRDAIRRGDVVGPRMYVSGGSLAITGGHGDPTNGFREDLMGIPGPERGVVDGTADAMHGTRLAIKRGADHIKITATGGVLSLARTGDAPQFTEDEVRTIVQTAGDFGLKVAAHAHGDEGMQRAVRGGVASVEHGTYMSDETMALMKERGTYLVPTITAGKSVADSARIEGYFSPQVTPKALEIGPLIQDAFARAYEAGVPIAFGTDAGVFRHGRNAVEFGYMVEAGMPPFETIKAATVHAADLIGVDDLGTLRPGARADVIATSNNPLEDITALQSVDFVMKDGVVFKQEGESVR